MPSCFGMKVLWIFCQIKKAYKIAEEYAHAGIKLLVDKIESVEFGSFGSNLKKNFMKRMRSSRLKLIRMIKRKFY